ncbi:MAG: gas vesicle protein GvpJ [Planctomycetota bacterium]
MPRTRLHQVARSSGRARCIEPQETILCDALDRVLSVGVAARGDLVIAVADVPLIKLSLGVLLASVETAEGRIERGTR